MRAPMPFQRRCHRELYSIRNNRRLNNNNQFQKLHWKSKCFNLFSIFIIFAFAFAHMRT